MIRRFVCFALVAASTGALVNSADAVAVATPDDTGRYADVNGLHMYYEVHGDGEPLVLLHGGLGGIADFETLLPVLAETRQVIAVELQGHGHTADIDRPMSFDTMTDDVVALIEHLDLDEVDVVGFSLGAGIVQQLAIDHADVIRRGVVISAAFRRQSIRPEFRHGMDTMTAENAAALEQTPSYAYYATVAPDPGHWPQFVGKLGDMLRQDYNWGDELATVDDVPMLIVAGDSDYIPAAHAAELLGALGADVAGDFVGMPASQLAILPGTSHFTILTRTDLLAPLIIPFLAR